MDNTVLMARLIGRFGFTRIVLETVMSATKLSITAKVAVLTEAPAPFHTTAVATGACRFVSLVSTELQGTFVFLVNIHALSVVLAQISALSVINNLRNLTLILRLYNVTRSVQKAPT